MSIVVDASVALKWVLDEPGAERADALLDEALTAPGLWLVEAANALWRRARAGEIDEAQATERLEALRRAPVTTAPVEEHVPAALAIAHVLDHPVYDCVYLALAIQENTVVVTADRRFHAAAGRDPDLAARVRLL